MDITELKAKYEVNGNLKNQMDSIYPSEITIYSKIEHVISDGCGYLDISSDRAITLTLKVSDERYEKEQVKDAMKIACLKFLEEFC